MRKVQEAMQKRLGWKDERLDWELKSDETLFQYRLFVRDQADNLKPSVRAFFIFNVVRYLTGWSFEQTIQDPTTLDIMLVGEYCITIMYLNNHYHDEKVGVDNDAKRLRNKQGTEILQKQLTNYIATHFEESTRKQVQQFVEELFRLYKEGMILDNKKALSYKHFANNSAEVMSLLSEEARQRTQVDDFLKLLNRELPGNRKHKITSFIQEEYFKTYLTRSFLINGIFFELFARLSVQLLGYDASPQKIENLIVYARHFGLAQQIVNDITDFIPLSIIEESVKRHKQTDGEKPQLISVFKYKEDTFCDLRRELITFPLIAYFSEFSPDSLPEKITAFRETYLCEKGTVDLLHQSACQEKVFQKLIQSKALWHARQRAKFILIAPLRALCPEIKKILAEPFYVKDFNTHLRYNPCVNHWIEKDPQAPELRLLELFRCVVSNSYFQEYSVHEKEAKKDRQVGSVVC